LVPGTYGGTAGVAGNNTYGTVADNGTVTAVPFTGTSYYIDP
jgi:hypothetical protein